MATRTCYLDRPIAEWIDALADEDPLKRRLAAHALGVLGPEASDATAALRAALRDPATFVRVWAGAALARVDPNSSEPVEALLEALHDEHSFVRSLAAWHLGRMARFNRPDTGNPPALRDRVIAALRPLLEDPVASVRDEAGKALERVRHKGHPPIALGPHGPRSTTAPRR